MTTNNQKVSFTKLGSILAVISSAVGLGNIWKFPSMVGNNGGSAFLFIYILSSLFASLPVLLAEFYIGYKTKQSPINAINTLSNNKKIWQSITHLSFITTLLICSFYSDVIGWSLKYFISALTGNIQVSTIEEADALFVNTISSPISVVVFQIIVLILTLSIISFGAIKGIEKTITISLPVLLAILIGMACFTLTLPGRNQALSFLFKLDFSKITSSVLINALGLAFFKLSAGMVVMTNYFSNFPDDSKPASSILKLLFADLGVSLLCGIVIFPVIFTYTTEVPSGAGLLFVSAVVLFKKLAFGNLLLTLFMLLAFLAGIGALISLTAYSHKYLEDRLKISRNKACIISFILIAFMGIFASLSTTSVLSEYKILGKNLFDLFDYISSNIILPLTGLLIIALILFEVKKDVFETYLTNLGSNKIIIKVLSTIMTYITPLLILFIWFDSLGLI